MNLQTWIVEFLTFYDRPFIRLLVSIAFFTFLVQIVRFFVFNVKTAGDKEKGKKGGPAQARMYLQWSITAFVVILCLGGIIMLLVNSLALDVDTPTTPDYMELKGWELE
jgi:uncharacterized membrane protein